MPSFDNTKIEESYSRIAAKHAEHLRTEKLRFTRGAIYRSNVGLVRFEGTGADLVACHDLYWHPPGIDRAALSPPTASTCALRRAPPALRTDA